MTFKWEPTDSGGMRRVRVYNIYEAIDYIWTNQDNVKAKSHLHRDAKMWNILCHIIENSPDTVFTVEQLDKFLLVCEGVYI
jgi:hypothetical protein